MKHLKFWTLTRYWVSSKSIYIILVYLVDFILLSFFKTGALMWVFSILTLLSIGLFVVMYLVAIFNYIKLCRMFLNSPLTLIVGALGSGKTLLMTFLSQFIKSKSMYTNWKVNDDTTSAIGLNNLDFSQNRKSPIGDSMIFLDEIFLYLNGNEPKKVKDKWKGTIPFWLLGRQFDYNLIFAGQRYNQHWIEYREIGNLIVNPVLVRKPNLLGQYFKMEILAFSDTTAYDIWYTECIKNLAKGEKVKLPKSSKRLGIFTSKVIIPLEIANKYDSKYLSFLRDLKNDYSNVPFKKWKDVDLNSVDTIKDLGMSNLIDNLGFER